MKKSDLSDARSGIQVIARAAAILRALKDSESGMSLGQIAEVVELPRSTVQRIVSALQSENFVIANANGGGLRIGPEVSALAEATRYRIVGACRPLLMELTQATGETTDLSVLRGRNMVFLDQVPGKHRLRTVSSVGEAFPLTTTANGRACLARLRDDDVRKFVEDEWERRGLTGDLTDFMASLRRVRETGMAYDLDENTKGISAVGISFVDWSGDLHAISVPVPTARFDEQRATIDTAIGITATRVQKMMKRHAA